MGPIRSSKAMATGLLLLVLFNVAAATLAESYSNSTEIESPKHGCRISAAMCVGVGLLCGCNHSYNSDNCCCTLAKSDCVLSICVAIDCSTKEGLRMGTDAQNLKQIE